MSSIVVVGACTPDSSTVTTEDGLAEYTAVISQIRVFMSGQLRDLVSSDHGPVKEEDYTGIKAETLKLLDNTTQILQTSYRESSDELRSNCNFLMITVYLNSLMEDLERLGACRTECPDAELQTIKQHIELNHNDLDKRSGACSEYLTSRRQAQSPALP